MFVEAGELRYSTQVTAANVRGAVRKLLGSGPTKRAIARVYSKAWPASYSMRAAPYHGNWTGVVNCLYDPGLWAEDECAVHFTLDIRGPLVLVEQIVRSKKGEETKSNINPGKFTFVRVSTNAIATSIDTGKDEDGLWVE